jgi:hypothetical protein
MFVAHRLNENCPATKMGKNAVEFEFFMAGGAPLSRLRLFRYSFISRCFITITALHHYTSSNIFLNKFLVKETPNLKHINRVLIGDMHDRFSIQHAAIVLVRCIS